MPGIYTTLRQSDVSKSFSGDEQVVYIKAHVNNIKGLLDTNSKILTSLLPSHSLTSQRICDITQEVTMTMANALQTIEGAQINTGLTGGALVGSFILVGRAAGTTFTTTTGDNHQIYADESLGLVSNGSVPLQSGDWLILLSTAGTSPIVYTWGVLNNTYKDATTAAKGVVQLSDSANTTSSVLAATPTAVKAAKDAADAAQTTASGKLSPGSITAGTFGRVTVATTGLVTAGSALEATDIPVLDTAKITTGTLGVVRGGTGQATLTSGNILLGNGTNGINSVAPATGFNKAFGSGAGTVTQGNDSRLSDARTPTSHVHGNVTNDGKIGTDANQPIITTTGGVLITGVFGSAAAQFCEGNDSRLSNARTPVSHAHGSISNDGKVGTAANIPIITGTGGVVGAGSFGSAANTFCQGDDSRLADARTPVAHNFIGHTITGLTTGHLLKATSATEYGFSAGAKGDVGLSNVENYGIATDVEAKAGTVSNKYMTPQRTAEAISQLGSLPYYTTIELANAASRPVGSFALIANA